MLSKWNKIFLMYKKNKKAKPNLLYRPCTLFSIGLFTRKPCLLKGRLHCLKIKSVLNPVNVRHCKWSSQRAG